MSAKGPNLTIQERTLLGFLSLFLSPRRLSRAAIIIKPSTLLSFHYALKKRNYRLLYSPRIDLFRAGFITLKTHWIMLVLDPYTRRIIGFAVHVGNCQFQMQINSLTSYPCEDSGPC